MVSFKPVSVYLLMIGVLLSCTACAVKRSQTPDAPETPDLPEVTHIRFQGHEHFGRSELRKAMVTKQRPLIPPWKRGDLYNAPTLQEDLRRLKKFYFDRGFLETVVRLDNVIESEQKQTIELYIVIDEGPRTTVQEVALDGTIPAALPAAPKLLQELPLKPGEPLTKAAFDQSKALVLQHLQDAGYARAEIVPRTEVDFDTHLARVSFTLKPGDLTSFGQITLKGMERVKERAIRRQLTIHEGQQYNAKGLTESADAIYELGMFQAVTPRALNLDQPGTPLDIEYEIRERRPRTIGFGIGFSTVESLRLQVRWTHRNLFGGAEELVLPLTVSGVEQAFEPSLHFPYFLAPRNRFTLTLFLRNEQELQFPPFDSLSNVFNIEDPQPAYDLFSAGAVARVDHEFTRTLTGALGMELSFNNFRNVDAEALEASGEDAADDNILLTQFVEMRWNTSDNLLNPTRGTQLRTKVSHANDTLLSDVSFVKVELEGRHYVRLWWQMILAMRLEIGGIQPYGSSSDVPFNVRFFAGGPGSVRGFTYNRLGPLDDNDEPIGGNSLIEGSVELRFPVLGNIGGVLFVDFGNVFRNAFTYHLDELRYAVGPGIRYYTPIGPFRLDVGFIVDRRSGEDVARFEFSIGQAF